MPFFSEGSGLFWDGGTKWKSLLFYFYVMFWKGYTLTLFTIFEKIKRSSFQGPSPLFPTGKCSNECPTCLPILLLQGQQTWKHAAATPTYLFPQHCPLPGSVDTASRPAAHVLPSGLALLVLWCFTKLAWATTTYISYLPCMTFFTYALQMCVFTPNPMSLEICLFHMAAAII